MLTLETLNCPLKTKYVLSLGWPHFVSIRQVCLLDLGQVSVSCASVPGTWDWDNPKNLTLTLDNHDLQAQTEAWAYINQGILCWRPTHCWLQSGMGVWGPVSLFSMSVFLGGWFLANWDHILLGDQGKLGLRLSQLVSGESISAFTRVAGSRKIEIRFCLGIGAN